ncbi:hypothetical protein D3C71_2009880 [compost metagenome]
MRFLPAAGWKAVASMAVSARSRRVLSSSRVSSMRMNPEFLEFSGSSMRMNHWGVLRKMIGALERQECG